MFTPQNKQEIIDCIQKRTAMRNTLWNKTNINIQKRSEDIGITFTSAELPSDGNYEYDTSSSPKEVQIFDKKVTACFHDEELWPVDEPEKESEKRKKEMIQNLSVQFIDDTFSKISKEGQEERLE